MQFLPEAYADKMYAALVALGYSGATLNMLNTHLSTAFGYTGSLPDKWNTFLSNSGAIKYPFDNFINDLTNDVALGITAQTPWEGAADSTEKVTRDQDDATTWAVVAATVTDTLEVVNGHKKISIASTGAISNRVNAISVGDAEGAITAGLQVRTIFRYIAGTSGKVFIDFRNNATAQETSIEGTPGGSYTAVNTAGVAQVLRDDDMGTYRELEVVWTPSADGTMRVGIGPDSSVVGEDIYALYCSTVQSVETFSANSYHTVGMFGDSLTDIVSSTLVYLTGDSLVHHPIYFGGVSGETSTQIKTRFLAADAGNKDIAVIWAGRNNFSDPTQVKADIAAMVANLTHDRYVVVGILNRDDPTEFSGQAAYNTIITLNSDLGTTYGVKYLEVREPIVAAYDPLVPADVVDFGNDVPPGTLRYDATHLNYLGQKIASDLLVAKLTALYL